MSLRSTFLIALMGLVLLGPVSCNKTPPPEWGTYTSLDHLFKIQYPIGWKTDLNGHAFNITTPDATGLVSVTGYIHPGPIFDEGQFREMVMLDFSECREKLPFKPVTLNNWVGEDAVYERWVNGQRTNYLFRIAHRGQVGVFVAVSEIDAHLEQRMPNYKQTMDSLFLLTPPVEKYQGKYKEEDEQAKKKKPWQEHVIDWLRSTE